jgi:hypothetical protein
VAATPLPIPLHERSLPIRSTWATCHTDAAREKVTVVLPALQCVFLEEAPPSEAMWEDIKPFMIMWQLSSYPVTISRWEGMRAED